MKLEFDRADYLHLSSMFEKGELFCADDELNEFKHDAEELAFELAYTRYALAKIESEKAELKSLIAQVSSATAKKSMLVDDGKGPEKMAVLLEDIAPLLLQCDELCANTSEAK